MLKTKADVHTPTSNKKRQRTTSFDFTTNTVGVTTTAQQDEKVNQYNGWTVPHSNYQIPILSTDDNELTPEGFYRDYIQHRRPVVIRGKLPAELINLNLWKSSNKHMTERAGDESIMVEKRSNNRDSFGRGNEIAMSFRNFMKVIEEGDNMHYLTTQDVAANKDGRPDLMSSFMKKLRGQGENLDFPLRLNLAGNLVPQNINLWIGNSKDGTSSGLHHDYHDNFYIVLRGTKRFRLFSPADTEKMYTRGKLVKVHKNGRINYEGEITTAYGADLNSCAAALAEKKREEAEELLAKAEKAVEDGVPGAEEELERAEDLLDKAMAAILDAETSSVVDDEEEEFHLETATEDDVEGIEMDEMSSSSEEVDAGENTDDTCGRLVDKTVKNPNNFSKVDPSLLDDEEKLKENFPEILEASNAFCTCHPGDILYLPASWFHEVRSSSGSDANSNGHMAFNYWFHPPDAENDFKNPYSTDFWSNDFENRSK
mmetsp:Transcript_24809/g.58625  ORF Transcript_24809/g.58625 Transcript_24809/m.58625 type:complete len:484 (+) Transcript_24809:160-1611(+)|eukprot:CAMPEP_0172404726 /NCGR_PEP_ID=MMETSP1061-20121228/64151_1 /TAXON_ID=37318 /ORGANISM="Pseudo-nitzschia pungens, Strain cf. pungens" /LENGTH=483 /DNA_ID=CAMNT_0013139643 /DNA_START=146 /DNA_END=1597 /DNA_ORIENTATION=-